MRDSDNNQWKTIIDKFPDNSTLMQYLNGLQHLNSKENQKLFEDEYLPIIKGETRNNEPFLSVVVRTQGKRIDGLREALLCLYAQEDQDFEIILIAHKASEKNIKIIEEILEDQDEEWRTKIRFYKLNKGTRTTPLNYGSAHAWGKYVAFFDDDDILFSNWTQEFKSISTYNEGRILHSYAFAQDWEQIDHLGYCAISAPAARYCYPFDLIKQLSVNRCPLMTIAFPTYIFQKVGVIFDETLNVTEDWEYFMRTAFLCGVTDADKPTAIYRFWKNIETSATLHDQNNWDITYKKIQENYNRHSVILPSGNIEKIINLSTCGNSLIQPATQVNNGVEMMSQLFYSKGDRFSDNQSMWAPNLDCMPGFNIKYSFNEKTNEYVAMRFDLCEEGYFKLTNFSIDILFTNKETKTLTLRDCIHNGIEKKDSVLFVNPDPEIIWEINDSRVVDEVIIKGRTEKNVERIKWIDMMTNLLPLSKCMRKRRLHRKGLY